MVPEKQRGTDIVESVGIAILWCQLSEGRLHVAQGEDTCFEHALLCCDYLNCHSDVQKKYQWFKLDAVEKYPDLSACSVKEMDIYCEKLAQAEIWKANQGGT